MLIRFDSIGSLAVLFDELLGLTHSSVRVPCLERGWRTCIFNRVPEGTEAAKLRTPALRLTVGRGSWGQAEQFILESRLGDFGGKFSKEVHVRICLPSAVTGQRTIDIK